LVGAAAVALLSGCGDSGREKAATRPEQLFATPPPGFRYLKPDAPTLERFRQAVEKDAPDLGEDDLAVRRVEPKGGLRPVAIGVAIDLHTTEGASRVVKGFDDAARDEIGKPSRVIQVAGSEAHLARVAGSVAIFATKNGYAVEAIAADARTAKVVVRRLIGAAAGAKR
jgi:hypothetical protein